ncbi:Uncharacterized protein FWK35_00024102 [Aphis craccivora]|uniref:Uncharacterized protein n=1 Tax=Aphis craccivora TaxID=307492 RepID=A0A6G0VSJ5_APHCR|nr:Uncharacterized protein FWK35_00024102 [Aphis craccivora]
MESISSGLILSTNQTKMCACGRPRFCHTTEYRVAQASCGRNTPLPILFGANQNCPDKNQNRPVKTPMSMDDHPEKTLEIELCPVLPVTSPESFGRSDGEASQSNISSENCVHFADSLLIPQNAGEYLSTADEVGHQAAANNQSLDRWHQPAAQSDHYCVYQQRESTFHERHRAPSTYIPPEFPGRGDLSVGDWVYYKAHPKSSAEKRLHAGFAPKWLGLVKLGKLLGTGVFLTEGKQHIKLHVSAMKRAVGPTENNN